jgi:hypothetical protein
MTAARFSMRGVAARVGAAVAALTLGSPAVAAENGYPTMARVEYVLECMAANGETYFTMQKCACSIDTIASLVPYERYERVETILRMREGRGELSLMFRTSPALEAQVQAFKQAQVEADLRCF